MRLEITRRADLAVRSMTALAEVGGPLKGSQLAEVLDATPGYMSQVLNPLVKVGWVASEPGPSGGYHLVADISRVSVLDVVEVIDGPTDDGRCVVADRPCSETAPCALHHAWARARHVLTSTLADLSLADISSGVAARPLSPIP